MQNKVELFDHGLGQKMGCNKLLNNSKWAANYKKQMGFMFLPQIWRLTCGPTKFMHTQGFSKKETWSTIDSSSVRPLDVNPTAIVLL